MGNSDSYLATGRIYHIGEVRVISEKFSVQEFVLTIEGQYPQSVLFQCANKKTDLLKDLSKDDHVTVHFNLRGREVKTRDGNTRFFNSLDAWRIETHTNFDSAPPPVNDDDVPF